MDAKLLMQVIPDGQEELSNETPPKQEEDNVEAQKDAERIITSNFQDYNGEDINDLIQCTTPRAVARAWLTGGMTQKHIDDGVIIMINESYDRSHPANKFMQNVHFSYQYYLGNDLPSGVLEAVNNGDIESTAFRTFFLRCLDKSAAFKIRNRKHCKASERYSSEKPARANANRVVKRAFR